MASVNGKRTEGSIKELTDPLHPDPLGIESNTFDSCLLAREPSRIEGWEFDNLIRNPTGYRW